MSIKELVVMVGQVKDRRKEDEGFIMDGYFGSGAAMI